MSNNDELTNMFKMMLDLKAHQGSSGRKGPGSSTSSKQSLKDRGGVKFSVEVMPKMAKALAPLSDAAILNEAFQLVQRGNRKDHNKGRKYFAFVADRMKRALPPAANEDDE